MRRNSEFPLGFDKQRVLILLVTWIGLSIAQSAHFYYYFDQPLALSFEWGFRDWLVWFCLVGVIRLGLLRAGVAVKPGIDGIALIALICFLCGWLQILIIIALDFLTSEPSRPFLDDFWHLYQKRWLQNIAVFGLLWAFIGHLLSMNRASASVRSVDQRPDRIRIDADGAVVWLKVDDICRIEAAGNYVCVEAGARRYVVRSTLIQVSAKLPESGFLRISRSCLVNQSFIESCARITRYRVEVRLVDGSTCSVGRTYWPKVREALQL